MSHSNRKGAAVHDLPPTLVFSTANYQPLAQAICDHAPFQFGQLERKYFADGERYQRLLSSCTNRDVVVVGGTISDDDTLELYDLASGVSAHGARRLTLVIPYFGYSTMERAVKSGEIVTAKARARLLSSIPNAAMGNRVILVDLHVEGLTHYFESDIHPVHLYAKDLIVGAARAIGGSDFILACTDAGRAKWVESLASDLGVSVAFVYKRRTSGSETVVTGVSAHVADKIVVIYDDMIRTGGSLIGAARAYRDAGAAQIHAICTHGLFNKGSISTLSSSGLFASIIATDTHPGAEQAAKRSNGFLTIRSVAPLLADALKEPNPIALNQTPKEPT